MIHLGFAVLAALHVSDTEPVWPAAPTTESDRLATHIRTIYPRCRYARTLASAILLESKVRGLDPALFTAIAWTESGFRPWVTGKYGSIGLWQLLPGPWLEEPWNEIRDVLDPHWEKLSRRRRERVLRSVLFATYMAGWVVEYHLGFCGDHRARCYARYQTGRSSVSPAYVRHLEQRSAAVRRALRGE